MATRTLTTAALVALLALVPAGFAVADNARQFGDITVHYNAFTSDTLTPEVARRYGLARSKSRGVLNITVLQNTPEGPPKAVKAEVQASASNLSGQLKTFSMEEIREREAIYYIAQFRIADAEVLNFTIDVKPTGSDEWRRLAFQQQFFTR